MFHSVLCLLQHLRFPPIKDGLQPLGEGCDWRLCTGIMRLTTSKLETRVQSSWKFSAVRGFFLRGGRLVSPASARQMLHPEDQPFQHCINVEPQSLPPPNTLKTTQDRKVATNIYSGNTAWANPMPATDAPPKDNKRQSSSSSSWRPRVLDDAASSTHSTGRLRHQRPNLEEIHRLIFNHPVMKPKR